MLSNKRSGEYIGLGSPRRMLCRRSESPLLIEKPICFLFLSDKSKGSIEGKSKSSRRLTSNSNYLFLCIFWALYNIFMNLQRSSCNQTLQKTPKTNKSWNKDRMVNYLNVFFCNYFIYWMFLIPSTIMSIKLLVFYKNTHERIINYRPWYHTQASDQ